MPTVSEEKNAHYRVIEQRVSMAKVLEHFINCKDFAESVSFIYQKDPFYYNMGVESDDLLQEVETGIKICIEQLKDQVKGYLV